MPKRRKKKTQGHKQSQADPPLPPPPPLDGRVPAPELYIAQSNTGKGRGAFAARPFRAGEVVEYCPVILLSRPYSKLSRPLQTVVFDWGTLGGNRRASAVALGYGSIYNHADPSNMTTSAWPEGRFLVYTAARDIEADEELTINYNARGGGHTSDDGNWWFKRLNIEPID